MKFRNNFIKVLRLVIFVSLLISPIISVYADTINMENIGNTDATIKGINYKIEGNNILLSSNANVELSGNAKNYNIVVTENSKDVTIILNNYTSTEIDGGYNNSNKIELKEGSSATVTLIGVNNLLAGNESSAIRVPVNTALIINGEGTLIAGINNGNSSASSAVIGSQYSNPFGSITINSGNITTHYSGVGDTTGIGSGDYYTGAEMSGVITLNGGSIHTDVLGSNSDSDKVFLEGNGNAVVYADDIPLNSNQFNGIIMQNISFAYKTTSYAGENSKELRPPGNI